MMKPELRLKKYKKNFNPLSKHMTLSKSKIKGPCPYIFYYSDNTFLIKKLRKTDKGFIKFSKIAF